jgi:hypothetical protein
MNVPSLLMHALRLDTKNRVILRLKALLFCKSDRALGDNESKRGGKGKDKQLQFGHIHIEGSIIIPQNPYPGDTDDGKEIQTGLQVRKVRERGGNDDHVQSGTRRKRSDTTVHEDQSLRASEQR